MAYSKFKALTSSYNFTSLIKLKDIPIYAIDYLDENEKPLYAYKTFKDVAVFTNKGIMLFNKSGITYKMKEVFAIPYRSIITCAVFFGEFTSEIKLTLYNSYPIKLRFMKSCDKVQIKKMYQMMLSKMKNI